MNRLYATILTIFVFVSGLLSLRCGVYSFSGSTLPPHIKTVGIPLFEDRTTEFGIDQLLTDALIEAITDDNTLKIANPRESDTIISGVIMSVKDRTGQYNANESAGDYRVFVGVKIQFEDVKKRTILWEDTINQWGSYESNRDDGIEEALDKISTEIINRSVSGW
ncbi:hypothetical protein HQ585_08660 [candidate division KSB1 bacterium]|nr:hypothetical protein [candidate division KSB1 bacterium]